MKRSKRCPKCDSTRIGYLPTQVDANDPLDFDDDGVVERTRDTQPRALGLSAQVTDTGTSPTAATTRPTSPT